MTDYFHLTSTPLGEGSVVLPGNWGRIIRAAGWSHALSVREMALEYAREAKYPDRPSRLDGAFAFLSQDDAEKFKKTTNGFAFHLLYRVSLVTFDAPLHIADATQCAPHGVLRANWPDLYWMNEEDRQTSLWGPNWRELPAAQAPQVLREVVTLSPLRIEERITAPT